jgi:hypothetical protein
MSKFDRWLYRHKVNPRKWKVKVFTRYNGQKEYKIYWKTRFLFYKMVKKYWSAYDSDGWSPETFKTFDDAKARISEIIASTVNQNNYTIKKVETIRFNRNKHGAYDG